jgi:hypothetical protein
MLSLLQASELNLEEIDSSETFVTQPDDIPEVKGKKYGKWKGPKIY